MELQDVARLRCMLNCIAVADNALQERSLWVECPFVVVQYSIRTLTAVNRFLVGLVGSLGTDHE